MEIVTIKIGENYHHLYCREYLGMYQVLSGVYQGGLIRKDEVVCL